MYTVFDPTKTILVDYQDKNFIVEDLLSRDSQCIPENQFYWDAFKYQGDFFRKFLKCFNGKSAILFTCKGESQYMHLKMANREGIF